MNRREFIKALCVISVAPVVVVSLPEVSINKPYSGGLHWFIRNNLDAPKSEVWFAKQSQDKWNRMMEQIFRYGNQPTKYIWTSGSRKEEFIKHLESLNA